MRRQLVTQVPRSTKMSPFRAKELDFFKNDGHFVSTVTTNCPYQSTVDVGDNRFILAPQAYGSGMLDLVSVSVM
jgi:hypothetical protein